MFLAQIVRVAEEGNAKSSSGVGVIGARVSEDSVALTDERFGEKLSEVAEPDHSDFQACRSFRLSLQLRSDMVVNGGLHGFDLQRF